jgi:ethanolamine kinase
MICYLRISSYAVSNGEEVHVIDVSLAECLLLCLFFLLDPKTVFFIDYEYASPNFRGFDIGNHFCEHAGFECDYSQYPDHAFQSEFIKCYLVALNLPATKQDVARVVRETNAFALLAHTFWTVWALVQANHSDLDFDYLEYAGLRWKEYQRRKEEWLQ